MRAPKLDLVSGAPFWPIAGGLPAVYPPLTEDQRCTVAVVGAGITGALVILAESTERIDVVVVDRRDVAQGSTAASSALLTWELDLELTALAERVGAPDAIRAWRLSLSAIDRIGELVRGMPGECGFARRSSLYLASHRRDVAGLEREAELRAEHGFPSEFWNESRLASSSAFRAPGAIRSESCGEIDPYLFTHGLLARASARGARIFDRTDIIREEAGAAGVTLVSARGRVIRAERVVMALGYEIPRPLRRDIVKLHSTYVLVTDPTEPLAGWEDRCLVWESDRPYRYLRTTGDGRVMCGGEDEPFKSPARRDRLLPGKIARLQQRLTEWLPGLRAEPAYGWTGTFGDTEDGLPYVGEWREASGRIFALGYGGNGITFGVIASEIIRDWCLGRANEDARIFRLDR